jgi:flagellum-specific ATP synthase
VLERSIYERGRYPAVDVLKSVSRALPKCNNDWENKVITHARKLLAVYNDMADMIRLGAYKKGADVEIDNAIKYYPLIEEFLRQLPSEHSHHDDSFNRLAEILEIPK